MSAWFAALIAVAAVTVTYLSCVRPILRGRGHCGMARGSEPESDINSQIAELREELRVLRAQDSLASGRVPGSTPTPRPDV
ncbi:MAG: hypothetical protein ACRDST_23665 [Pseudonocardiaceae bacterium]